MLNLNANDLKRAWFQLINDKINLIIHDHSQLEDMKSCTHARLRHAYTTFDQMLDELFGIGASSNFPYLYRMSQVILNERVDKFFLLAEGSRSHKPIQYPREDSKAQVMFSQVIKILEGEMGYECTEADLPVNDVVLFQIMRNKKISLSSLVTSNESVKKQVEQEQVRVKPSIKLKPRVKAVKETKVKTIKNPAFSRPTKKVHKLY